jgi:D-glycero-D-manno-heptose 1,7-bisphosphate phosphatase
MTNKAIFLDRDGVINRNTHYVNKLEDFEILPQVPDAIKILKEAGFKIFVVTNQGGIEKGLLDEEILQNIHWKMKQVIPEIDDIRHCPFNTTPSFERKPNPGMIYDLAYEHEIFLNESYMIGDWITDCIAGKRAGCTTILLETNIEHSMKHHNDKHINNTSADLMSAVLWILHKEGLN